MYDFKCTITHGISIFVTKPVFANKWASKSEFNLTEKVK